MTGTELTIAIAHAIREYVNPQLPMDAPMGSQQSWSIATDAVEAADAYVVHRTTPRTRRDRRD